MFGTGLELESIARWLLVPFDCNAIRVAPSANLELSDDGGFEFLVDDFHCCSGACELAGSVYVLAVSVGCELDCAVRNEDGDAGCAVYGHGRSVDREEDTEREDWAYLGCGLSSG